MKMTKRATEQLKAAKLVLIGLAAIVLLVVIWLAWGPPAKKSIDSYQECVEQGGRVLLTYPGQCITDDNRSFTQP